MGFWPSLRRPPSLMTTVLCIFCFSSCDFDGKDESDSGGCTIKIGPENLCGNGVLDDPDETCDGGVIACSEVPGGYFTGGTAVCLSDCSGWDTDTCTLSLLVLRREIAAGKAHTCAIGSEGTLFCWGANDKGQCGTGSPTPVVAPTKIPAPAGQRWVHISAGDYHTCAITDLGMLFCWGDNASGQIGDDTTTMRYEPTPIASDIRWSVVSARDTYTTALTQEGTPYCWGTTDNPCCSSPNKSVWEPMDTSNKWIFLTGTYGLTSDGSIYRIGDVADDWCVASVVGDARRPSDMLKFLGTVCGLNSENRFQCYQDTEKKAPFPESINHWGDPSSSPSDESFPYRAADTNVDHQCTLSSLGTLTCTGNTAFGKSGAGLYGSDWEAVATGYNHTCLKKGDQIACFGANNSGQWGTGDFREMIPQPRRVESSYRWEALALDYRTSCGLDSDGLIHCWGSLADGQETVEETGTFVHRTLPGGPETPPASSLDTTTLVAVPEPAAWRSITMGVTHACGISTEGDLYCWGMNDAAQCGLGALWDTSPHRFTLPTD